MNNQNNNLEKNNIFSKMKAWFNGLFHKPKITETNMKNQENVDRKPKDFFEEYKEKEKRRQYLFELQKKYKNKEMLEKDMSEEDKDDLEKLYIEQNMELKRKIKAYDSKIAKVNK